MVEVQSGICAALTNPAWHAIGLPWMLNEGGDGWTTSFVPSAESYPLGTYHTWWRSSTTFAQSDISVMTD